MSDCESGGEAEQVPIDVVVVGVSGVVETAKLSNFLAPVKRHGDYWIPVLVEPGVFMWVDEEGILKQLPENFVIGAVFLPNEPIVGNVVVTGVGDDDGNILPAPPRVIDALVNFNSLPGFRSL